VVSGALLVFALAVSYLESLVEPFIPIPGIKLGLANIAVMFAFLRIGKLSAALISLARVTFSFLLFGSFVSFTYSLSGAVGAYLALLTSYILYKKSFISPVGLSVICAVFHSLFQCFAAYFYFGNAAFSYILPLLLCALVTGIINGVLLIILKKRIAV
jgi:heptaprenyl diphosphate synthase